MFVILSYDVVSKRDGKVLKVCRRFLNHWQYSVFDGIITEAELGRLKEQLMRVIVPEEDSVCVYKFESLKFSKRESIGPEMYEGCVI